MKTNTKPVYSPLRLSMKGSRDSLGEVQSQWPHAGSVAMRKQKQAVDQGGLEQTFLVL